MEPSTGGADGGAVDGGDWRGLGIDSGRVVSYGRSASDLLRLVVFGALTVVMVAAARWADEPTSSSERTDSRG